MVVDYEHKTDFDGDTTPYPIVQFQAPDGRHVTARTDFDGDFVPAIGDQVDVLDPNEPEEVHIDTKLSNRINDVIRVVGWIIIGGAAIADLIVLAIFRDAWL